PLPRPEDKGGEGFPPVLDLGGAGKEKIDHIGSGVGGWSGLKAARFRPEERVVEINSGELTSGVNFVLESLHVFPSGLQLMSIPWDYSDEDPATLLDIPAGQLAMAAWEAGRQRYRVYPNAPADRFRLGFGYWLNLDEPADLTRQGTPSSSPASIHLSPGWNMIGTPFNDTVDFYSIDVVTQTGGEVLTIQEALSQNILTSGLFAYMLGGYRTVSTMTPFVGYWIRANNACELSIDADADTLGAAERSPIAAVSAPEDGWLMQLEASVGQVRDASLYLGISDRATDEFDGGLDQAKPPVPDMAPYVYVSGGSDMPQAVDIRGGDSVRQTWNVTVQTNQIDQPVRISWPDISTVPADLQPTLTDTATGRTVHMRTSTNYTFDATSEPRVLEISISKTASRHLVVSSAMAQQVGDGVNVCYTLSADAAVTVDVMNISGRRVSRVVRDDAQTAGQKSVTWNGSNAAGAKAPNGRYLLRITARSDDGQQASTITPVSIRR
ncbi:MAG: FlgD immunoglobulin-like domain containing protein, partial [Armatimonadota bacterium]